MTSSINTTGLDVNYPVPGVNNNSQGFRDNFATIKTNLNLAANEITDLQSKVVLKQALLDGTVNNDMANTVISNAATRSFRATTYNLGNALSGTVTIDVSLGDVQYGTVTGNTVLEFGGWAPIGTQSNVQLVLAFSNANAVLSFPTEVVNSNDFGVTTLENYNNSNANVGTITPPSGSNIVEFRLSTLDCGNSISIEPLNRPRQSTQIRQKDVSTTGTLGDKTGTVAVSSTPPASQTVCISTTADINYITCVSTLGFYLDMPIVFTGNTFGGIVSGVIYYVSSIPSATTFTVSIYPGTVNGPGPSVSLSTENGSMNAIPVTYLYIAGSNYNANSVTKTSFITTAETTTQSITSIDGANNYITITDTSSLVEGNPITFSGVQGTTYSTVTGANAAIIAGNVAVMTSSSISGTTLTIGSVSSGTVQAGMILTGTGVAANTYIVSGGGLSWTVSPSQTVGSTTITGTTGIVGTTLTVGSLTSGTITSGMWVNGPNVLANTYITGGSGSTWTVNNSQIVGLASANLTTSKVTVNDTGVFTVGMPVVCTGLTLGGLSGNYFVESIPDPGTPGNIRLSSTFGGSNVQVDYGTGNMTILYGGIYGNLSSTTTYYVKDIISSTQFTISNTIGGTTTDVNSGTGPASGPQVMNATAGTNYTITVNNTNNLIENSPIVFSGNVFGGINANSVYYINSIDSGNNKISISETIYNGIAGQKFKVSSDSSFFPMTITSYNGDNVWNAIPLLPLASNSNVYYNAGTFTGNLSVSGFLFNGVNNNVTANGSVQSTATLLTSQINNVTTVPLASGVKLPIAKEGMRVVVINTGGTTLNIYPNTGATINGGSANASVTLNTSSTNEFICTSSAVANLGGTWFSLK